jgi:PAS domain S-box-containing protein
MSKKQKSSPTNQKQIPLERERHREAQSVDPEHPRQRPFPALGIGISGVDTAARLAETARLLDLTNDAIIVRDTNNQITYWNRGASELFGWSTGEAMGKDLHSFLKTEFELPLEELLVKLREQDRLIGEVVQVARDGRRLNLLCRWALDRKADGTPASILTSTTDITERKQVARALEESHLRLESQVKERTASLQQLSSRLQRAQDDERRKIARDLHDSVGQYLTALKMNIALLRHPNSKDADKAREQADQLLDTCLAEIRTISYLLHPPLLDESGLSSAAQWYVEGFGTRSGIQVKLDVSKNLGRLPQPVETALFRVLQESLTNVHRHSGSKEVDVLIALEDGDVELIVRDYGRGISHETLEQYRTSNGQSSGVGLAGMRERVHELEGKLQLAPESPGTSLRVTIPIRKPITPPPLISASPASATG